MKAYHFMKMQLSAIDAKNAAIAETEKNQKNRTGLNICKMTGKLQDLVIACDDENGLHFRRSCGKGTIVKDYSENDVLRIMSMTGKAVGDKIKIVSLSTSVLENARCQERMLDPESICFGCYANAAATADTTQGRGIKRNLKKNSDKLFYQLLDFEKIPVKEVDFFRFESHGDLNDVLHLINYVAFCEKAILAGSKCKFALWTKNADFLESAFIKIGIEKPENLQIIYSSPKKDVVANIPVGLENIVDRVFTVWTSREKCDAAGYKLNCCDGIRKHTYCLACLNCYLKNDVKLIHELYREK